MPWAAIDLAYLAGFLDGEGSISINRSRNKGAHIAGSYVAHFNVGGTDEQTIRWIAETFNGEFKSFPNKHLFSNYKDSHKCRWTYVTGPPVLMAVMPFLKTKRLQALYYVEFVQYCSSILHGRSLPEDVRKRAGQLAALCASVSDHQSRWKGLSD